MNQTLNQIMTKIDQIWVKIDQLLKKYGPKIPKNFINLRRDKVAKKLS